MTYSASSRGKILCEDLPNDIARDDSEGDTSGSSGTAFFINNKGHLLTNNHVVEGCSLSKITYKLAIDLELFISFSQYPT